MSTPYPTSIAPTTAPPSTYLGMTAINDVVFNCKSSGFLVVESVIDGHSLSASYGLDDDELAVTSSITGECPLSALSDDAELVVTSGISGWGIANDRMCNWVGWSKIGQANFALDRVNDAGFKPMDWPGCVYKVIKLGKDVMIYGSGGVTHAFPVREPAPTFGFRNVLNVTIKNKEACTGDEHVHFCIDDLGCLYKITSEGVEVLGYEEFLRSLVNPVMVWDPIFRRLNISDSTTGYIYNDKALGGGFAALTGLYRLRNVLKAVSPADVVADPVHIVTDVIDFGHRGIDHIESLNWAVSADETLQSAIDYRYKKDTAWATTAWSTLNEEGVAHIKCSAVEFRFRLRSTTHGTFNLSRLDIQMKEIDMRFTRSLIDPTRSIG